MARMIRVSVFYWGDSNVELLVSDDGSWIHVRRHIPAADPDLTLRVFYGRDMIKAGQFYMGWVNDAVAMTKRFDLIRHMFNPPGWALPREDNSDG